MYVHVFAHQKGKVRNFTVAQRVVELLYVNHRFCVFFWENITA